MSTEQCKRLATVIKLLDDDESTQILILMGGRDFFSNGIHLNVIEASKDPALESWENINAIDDVVQAILYFNKTTVTALIGNAGAGGAMMAIASDYTWTHSNAILTPSYAAMNLFGSEYWTYSLPKRVGSDVALQLTASTSPVSAKMALELGLIDEILAGSSAEFVERVVERAGILVCESGRKIKVGEEEKIKMEECRRDELGKMKICFQDEEYHQKRRTFVFKGKDSACRAKA
jgi:putative two-component system hydrogenase maturation factor HypX/HoxX